jgi:hypothetical protein
VHVLVQPASGGGDDGGDTNKQEAGAWHRVEAILDDTDVTYQTPLPPGNPGYVPTQSLRPCIRCAQRREKQHGAQTPRPARGELGDLGVLLVTTIQLAT